MRFLIDNPFFGIIIIGIVSAIYKNWRKNNTVQSKKEEWLTRLDQTESHKKTVHQSGLSESLTKGKVVQSKITKNETNTISPITSKKKLNSPEIQADVEESIDLSPSKQNVMEGIIWAELIGPPRALRRHTIRRNTKRG